jgi:lipopolysaccharide transport system permease protein
MPVRIALADPPDFADLTGAVTAPPAAPPAVAQTVIEPARGWQWLNVRELWRHRELLFFLAWRDVKVRYKQTVLGVAWAVLQPALLMVVFTVFFARLAGVSTGDVPYPLFALAGLLPWTLFATGVTNAGNSVIGSERLITKIYFPRLAVPFAAAGAALVDFLVALGLLAVVMAVCGVAPSWNLVAAPVIVAIVVLASVGLGTLLAALNVAYRDVRYVIPFLIQVGMFATPTIYLQPTGQEGAGMQWLLTLNPMNGLVSAFRACLLGGPIPWADVAVAAALSCGLFLAGCLYFRKVEDGFADVI